MVDHPLLYLGLDVASAALTLVVAGFFLLSWRRSGLGLHLLLAVGFLIVGASFSASSTSQFEPEKSAFLDVVRIGGQTGGALVLVFAYVGARRHGDPRPWATLGWTAAAIFVLVAALFALYPPFNRFPSYRESLIVAHLVQTGAYALCTVLSSSSFRRAPTLEHLLVPARSSSASIGSGGRCSPASASGKPTRADGADGAAGGRGGPRRPLVPPRTRPIPQA